MTATAEPTGPAARTLDAAPALDLARVERLVVLSAHPTDETLGAKTHKVMFTPQISALRSFPPTEVPKGYYWVMGDNRDNSNDSRFIGFIERRRIVGKATAVAFSLDRSHHWVPRFDRFFTRLQ